MTQAAVRDTEERMFRTEERVRKGVFARPRKRVAVPVESVPLAGLRCDSNAVSSIRTRAAVPKGHITQRHFFGADDGVVDKAEKPGRRLADPDKRKSEVRLSFDPNGSAPSGSEARSQARERFARHMMSEVDTIVFGRDLDCSERSARPSAATAEAAAKPAHATVAPTPEASSARPVVVPEVSPAVSTTPSPRPPLPWPVPAGTNVRDRQRREPHAAQGRNLSYATDADRLAARQRHRNRARGIPFRRRGQPRTDTLVCAEHACQVLAEKLRNQHNSIQKAFRDADLNHNGELDHDEVRSVFEKFHIRLPDDEYRAMMEKFDDNGDGGINYHEFLRTFGEEFLGGDKTDVQWGSNNRSPRAEVALNRNRQLMEAERGWDSKAFMPMLHDAAAAQQERTLYPPPTQAGCWWESPPRLPSRFGRITSAAPPPTARRLGGYARLQNGPVSAAEQLALPGTTVGILQRRICDVPRTAAKDEGEPRTATAALPRTGYGNLRPPTGAVPASPRLQTGASY